MEITPSPLKITGRNEASLQSFSSLFHLLSLFFLGGLIKRFCILVEWVNVTRLDICISDSRLSTLDSRLSSCGTESAFCHVQLIRDRSAHELYVNSRMERIKVELFTRATESACGDLTILLRQPKLSAG